MSTDGGSVWNNIDDYYGTGYDLAYAEGDTYWYTGYKYSSPNYEITVSVTDDNGASWTRHSLSSGSSYRYARALAVDPQDTGRVFVLAYENSGWNVYFTENGGSVWQSMPASGLSGTPYRLVVDPSDGSSLAAATSTSLYASSDGGASWSRVTTAFGSSTEAAVTSDGNDLLIGTSSEGIWKWENWTGTPFQIGDEPASIRTLYDAPNLYVYAGTPASSVWRSYYGTGVEGSPQGATETLSLAVHPNPVREGLASISFTLPFAGETRLAVYDITGRVMDTVMDSEMPAGGHSLNVSTDGLATGLYFLRLTHAGSASTTGMVVAK